MFGLLLVLVGVSERSETVEKVSGNNGGGSYEDVLIGSFPSLY
jgi:hypothetical protein